MTDDEALALAAREIRRVANDPEVLKLIAKRELGRKPNMMRPAASTVLGEKA